MVPEHIAKCLSNLLGVDGDTFFAQSLDLVFVKFHEFNVWVFLAHLKVVIDHFVMVVDAVDISQEVVQNSWWTGDRLMHQQCTAEINTCLMEVVGTEMVLGVRALIIATKT